MTDRRPFLYDTHVDLGAKIVPFGGWEMRVRATDGAFLNLEKNVFIQHPRPAVWLAAISNTDVSGKCIPAASP